MLENGKGAGGMGRNAYRDRRDAWERGGKNGYGDRNGHAANDSSSAKGRGDFISPTMKGSASKHEQGVGAPPPSSGQSPQAVIADIEKRLSGVSQDFNGMLRKISEKENEKFDLIFAILSELQGRQAQLEETVRQLNTQLGNGQGSNTSGSMPQSSQQQAHFNGSGSGQQSYGQMNGQVNGQMNGGGMNGQQAMQQYTGVMQADGSQAMYPMQQMQQVLVVQSPTGAGMQYAMPQMMSPNGQMPQMQMQAMQYMPQSPNGAQDMNGGYAAVAPGPGTPTGQEASSNGGAPASPKLTDGVASPSDGGASRSGGQLSG
mmetsp:Transcript_103276/g.267032  ORF Transcript_103276/g.267032 Transcript_103276/m.267032 type:complete len:316 (+) Transcript_103276:107-1054(+)